MFDEYTVAQLIEDIIEGALAGVVGFSDALGFLDRVIQNSGPYYSIWTAIFDAFSKIETMLHNTKHYNLFLVIIGLNHSFSV